MAQVQAYRVSRRRAPVRRWGDRRTRPRRRNWLKRCVVAAGGMTVALLAWAAIARHFAPVSNTSLTRFDAIIVLGTPADSDGNPDAIQLARVSEAVHEYQRGVAPRLIFTGGAAHNRFVEARVMARTAQAQGIPDSSLLVEPESMSTIQNACFADRIMKAHGWRSTEVVSSTWQLPRAGLIFSRLPLEWRVHAAPSLTPESPVESSAEAAIETLKTVKYLVLTRQTEGCEP